MRKLIIILLFLPLLLQGQINLDNNAVTLGGTTGLLLSGNSTQWDDVATNAVQTRVNPSTSKPTLNLDSLALEFVRDVDSNEIVYYSIQMPHRVVYSASAYCSPHFHYIQQAVGDTTFSMVLYYRIHKIGEKSNNWVRIIPTERASMTFTSAPFHQICEFSDIPLVNVSESSLIDFKMFRKDAAGLPATLWFKTFDVHFEIGSLGSPDEYPSH